MINHGEQIDDSGRSLLLPRSRQHSDARRFVGDLPAAGHGIDHNELLRLVEERLSLVPRYRQKVREVVLGLARPVWVDDRDFDITYHVRRSALPKPGSAEQLNDLIARLISRPLDNTRPLWEMYLVEGLADDRFAIFTKSHSALVDGETALEISQVLFDPQEKRRPRRRRAVDACPTPSDLNLLIGALADMVARPGEGVARARAALGDVTTSMTEAVSAVGKIAAVVRTAAQVAPSNPLNAPISRSRRLSVAKTPLDDYRTDPGEVRVRGQRRDPRGGRRGDAELAAVAGRAGDRGDVVRALVPMSVYIDGPDNPDVEDPQAPGHVSSFLIDLPVGEPNAVVRLSHVAHATEAFARAGPSGDRADHGEDVRVRARHTPCDECARGQQSLAAHVQPHDHQRAGSAVSAVHRWRADGGDVSGLAIAEESDTQYWP